MRAAAAAARAWTVVAMVARAVTLATATREVEAARAVGAATAVVTALAREVAAANAARAMGVTVGATGMADEVTVKEDRRRFQPR